MKKMLIYPAFLGLLQISINTTEASTPEVESAIEALESKDLELNKFKEKISELIKSLESVLTGEFIDQITRNSDIPFDMQLFVNEINSSRKLYINQNAQGFSKIISLEAKNEIARNKNFIDNLEKNRDTEVHVANLLSEKSLENVHHEFSKLLEERGNDPKIPEKEVFMFPKEKVINIFKIRNLTLKLLPEIDACLEYAYLINDTMRTCEELQSKGDLKPNVEINSSYLFWPHGVSVSGITFVEQKFSTRKRNENSVFIDLEKFRENLSSVKSKKRTDNKGQSQRERLNRFEAIQKLGKNVESFLILLKDPLVRNIDQVINTLKERKAPILRKDDFENFRKDAIAKLTGYKGNIQVLKCLMYQIELSLRRALLILANPQNNIYRNELSQGFMNDEEIRILFEYLNFPQLKDGVKEIKEQLGSF